MIHQKRDGRQPPIADIFIDKPLANLQHSFLYPANPPNP